MKNLFILFFILLSILNYAEENENYNINYFGAGIESGTNFTPFSFILPFLVKNTVCHEIYIDKNLSFESSIYFGIMGFTVPDNGPFDRLVIGTSFYPLFHFGKEDSKVNFFISAPGFEFQFDFFEFQYIKKNIQLKNTLINVSIPFKLGVEFFAGNNKDVKSMLFIAQSIKVMILNNGYVIMGIPAIDMEFGFSLKFRLNR